MRINARLDREYELKLAYLQQQTEQSVTEVIKSALDAYYESVSQAKPFDILMKSGFIGCGKAEPDLAENHKAKLADGLEDKYGSSV